tara:strand:+ start:1207 stop:2310 length:1104 start_codon:yes stop_codon:yes gene_type:complete
MNKLLSIDKTLLLGPGPSSVSPNVYKALSTNTIGHLDPRFIDIMDEIKQMLKIAFKTSNNFCIPVSGTGSAAMESCFVNMIEKGDKVLVIQNGYFGLRMENMCQRLGADLSLLKFDWGKAVDVNILSDHLKHNTYDVIAVVHAETSTGVKNPIKDISSCINGDSILIVDAVTSLGTIDIQVDNWNIDAIYSCSQKGLSCPPGASPISFSEKALNKMKDKKKMAPNWYLDMSEIIKYWDGQQRVYHHTAPINMMYALYQSLFDLIEEGIDNTIKRHYDTHLVLEEGLNNLGLNLLVDKESRLPSLNAIKIPNGINDLEVRNKLLNDYMIEIGGGLGPFAGKVWRIGLMGHSARVDNVKKLLNALKEIL